MQMDINPSVQKGIDQIKATFSGHAVDVDPDGEGGAFVRVNALVFGAVYEPGSGWVAFPIAFNYPHGDVYPHFVPGELARCDKKALGEGFTKTEMKLGKFVGPATQLSRRSNQWKPAVDTAALKLLKVLDFIGSRP
jgi:hypothetical protein